MQKSERIVRYTAEEIEAMRERGEFHTDWAYVDALTEEELEASIDIEEEGMPDWETVIIGMPGPVMQIVFDIDKETLDWFRKQGPGYQSRMNDVLRDHMEAEQRAGNG